ncbi:MAG: hypothetical protein K0S57_87 [Ramlibacter sp.]|jgi:endonuclease/exonuclease/phosphatase family metal-dependent hydrolase|nr:hypothetical protein [Ramlibacter sp.]
MSLRVLAWNVGHQTREAPIPDGLLQLLQEAKPDVLVLNECVDGRSRDALRAGILQLGLLHVLTSHRLGKHNQVLIASNRPISSGELTGPRVDGGAGESNFLHVRLDGGTELVGVRAPTYEGAQLRDYWAQLTDQIRSTKGRAVAWIGDFNADPDNVRSPGGKHLARLEGEGWRIPRAAGAWSFYRGSRIDHALLAPRLRHLDAQYLARVGEEVVIGDLGSPANVSDHAALLVELTDEP